MRRRVVCYRLVVYVILRGRERERRNGVNFTHSLSLSLFFIFFDMPRLDQHLGRTRRKRHIPVPRMNTIYKYVCMYVFVVSLYQGRVTRQCHFAHGLGAGEREKKNEK